MVEVATFAQRWRDAGWPGVLPLPAGRKHPPPSGFTGRRAPFPTGEQFTAWFSNGRAANLALRVPDYVAGVDVDDYDGKGGGETLTSLEASFGPLPATVISTSRYPDDPVSGIRLYRIPAGSELVGDAGPGIEIVQFHHRYAVVSPSTHPEGRSYRLVDQRTGAVIEEPPRPEELPELPESWLEGLAVTSERRVQGDLDDEEPAASNVETDFGRRKLDYWTTRLESMTPDGRHDVAVKAALSLAGLAKQGHLGWAVVCEELREAYFASGKTDRGEIERVLVSAWRKAKAWGPEIDVPPDGDPEQWTSRLMGGTAFALGPLSEVSAVWGRDHEVLWASGEPLMLVGPTGVGKTTLGQQVTLARCGVRRTVLGFPVSVDPRPVLYIAADRPAQAARSLRRMIAQLDDETRATVDRQLLVWRGPLPFDVTSRPHELLRLAQEASAGTVVIDSLKDVAVKLTDDEVGNQVNRALQILVSEGIEAASFHHQRKSSSSNTKPAKLDDVYGSVWLVNGAGSVVLLWGEAGDPIVELSHLKQPAETVGPFTLVHDHDLGLTSVLEHVDLLQLVNRSPSGITAKDAAVAVTSKASPSRADIEKARRKLERLVRSELIRRQEHRRPDGGDAPTLYLPNRPGGSSHGPATPVTAPDTALFKTAGETPHADPPPYKEGGVREGDSPGFGDRDKTKTTVPTETATETSSREHLTVNVTWSVDVETAGLHGRARLVAIHDGQCTWITDDIPSARRALTDHLEAGELVVAHNAGYDEAALDLPPGALTDTRVLSWFADPPSRHGLADLTGVDKRAIVKHLRATCQTWETIPTDDPIYRDYCAKDTEACWRLYHELPEPPALAWKIERRAAVALRSMERRGVRVDVNRARQLLDETRSRQRRIEAGLDLNPASPQQIAARLAADGVELPTTVKGAASVTEAVLTTIDHPLAHQALDWRKANKLASTYLQPLAHCDGRIHPTFLAVGARTGRMSCQSPNLQNIPRGHIIRDLFIPSQGHRLVVVDWSQMELRMYAHYAQDPNLIEAFNAGEDIHQWTADIVGVDRGTAKNTNFALAYGAGANKIMVMTGLDRQRAEAWRRLWDERFPKCQPFNRRLERRVTQLGYVELYDGRQLPVDRDKTFTGLNYLIQGSCAVLCKEALGRLVDEDLADPLVLVVHDEMVADIPAAQADDYARGLERVMSTTGDWRVTFTAQAKVVDRWGDAKEG